MCVFWASEVWYCMTRNYILSLWNLKPDNFITGQLLNVFKCVWINLGMWIYFFKCIFCEIQREIKYSWWKLSIWIKTCCKWTHSGFWRLGVKRNAKRPINLSVHCWNTELFWTFWVKCSWLWAVWVWTGRVCMCVDWLLTNTAAPRAPQPAQYTDRNGACRGPTGQLKRLDSTPHSRSWNRSPRRHRGMALYPGGIRFLNVAPRKQTDTHSLHLTSTGHCCFRGRVCPLRTPVPSAGHTPA